MNDIHHQLQLTDSIELENWNFRLHILSSLIVKLATQYFHILYDNNLLHQILTDVE